MQYLTSGSAAIFLQAIVMFGQPSAEDLESRSEKNAGETRTLIIVWKNGLRALSTSSLVV